MTQDWRQKIGVRSRQVLWGVVPVALLGTVSLAVLWVRSRDAIAPYDPNRTYIIGTDNAYPYHFMESGGGIGGMAGQVVAEAARRSGVKLQWRLLTAGPFPSLEKGDAEIWPLLARRPDRFPLIHFTAPYLRNAYVVLSKNPLLTEGTLDQYVHRVAHADFPLATTLAKTTFPRAVSIPKPNREEALAAVCRGEADAIVAEARAVQQMAIHRPPGCEAINLFPLGLNFPQTEMAIASSRQAAGAAEHLRDEIERMLADGTMATMLRRWNYYYSGEAETVYREREARRATQLSWVLLCVLSVCLIILAFLLVRVRRAQRAAEAANAAKSHFLASMSHEIRTPLHGVLGMGQVLADGPLTSDQREGVEHILTSGRALLDLVDGLLDIARLERGHLDLQVSCFDPVRLVTDAISTFRFVAGSKGLMLSAEGIENLPHGVKGDPARLRQVLVNLIGNAVKFTRQGSVQVRVSLSSESDNALLRCEVTDTGVGIAPQYRDRLFRRFSRGDPATSATYSGTGLGLAICRELVTAMNGRIGVSSQAGMGSTFWFEVPVAIDPEPAAREPFGSVPEMRMPDAAPVLLVEDNPVNQRIAAHMLARAGLEVKIASSGMEALEMFQSQTFAAVFMDCMMPDMDGFETTAAIRRLEDGERHTPIIAITASAMKGERVRCLAGGMDDYLAKPVDLAELNRVLAKWLAPRYSTPRASV